MKKVGISFSGGGAKAFIYLGVYKAFQDLKIPIEVIGGLSGGALVAAYLATGRSFPEILDRLKEIKLGKVLDYNIFDGFDVIEHQKIELILRDFLGKMKFNQLEQKTLILATDIIKKETVAISEGDVASAVLGSISIPPLFKAYEREGKQLIDGGFSVFYGANYFKELGAEVVIGCEVNGFVNVGLPFPFDRIYDGFSALCTTVEKYEMKLFPVDYEIRDFDDQTSMITNNIDYEGLIDLGYNHTMKLREDLVSLIS